jgi:hypothetical protein
MAKLPDKYDLSGPDSLRSGRPIASYDTTAIGRGVERFGAGLSSLGGSLAVVQQEERQRTNVLQGGSADGGFMLGLTDLERSFDQDGNYGTYEPRFDQAFTKLKSQWASGISDPNARKLWEQHVDKLGVAARDRVISAGQKGIRQNELVNLKRGLEDYQRVIADERADPAVRDLAKRNAEGVIGVAESTGLLSPTEAEEARETAIRGGNFLFVQRIADSKPWLITGTGDPNAPAGMRNNNPFNIKYIGQSGGGVVGPSQNTDQGDPQAVYATQEQGMRAGYDLIRKKYDGGKRNMYQIIAEPGGWTPPDYKPGDSEEVKRAKLQRSKSIAEEIARSMGVSPDADLNLNDPANAQRFMRALVTQEQGGAANAYSDAMIADAVAGRGRIGQPQNARFLWVGDNDRVNMIGGDARLRHVNRSLQERVAAAFTSVGINDIHIRSGFRTEAENRAAGGAQSSQHLHGNALDISVKGMPEAKKVEIIRALTAAGVTGIGVYDNTIHADLGGRRAWGPTYHRPSVPAWAEAAIREHEAATGGGGSFQRPPEFDTLTASQQFAIEERAEIRQQQMAAEASATARGEIEKAMLNAPTAILNTGRYTGDMPTAGDFAAALGADDGGDKFAQFQSSVETAREAYGLQTISGAEIAAKVAGAKADMDAATGDTAVLATQRYQTISGAADIIFKAREADPAGVTQQVFPHVGRAWEPEQLNQEGGYQGALSDTAAAQKQLGITNMQLLPKETASAAVERFKDESLSEADRLGQITQLIFGTSDKAQQKLVTEQLVRAGMPEIALGAIDAMARGDEGAAERLFLHAMVDPGKLPGKAPNQPAEIDQAIEDGIMADGMVGDIYYGLSDGTAKNFVAAKRDADLMRRSVEHRIRGGQSIEDAVAAMSKDMFGDVQAVAGEFGLVNAQILIPADADKFAAIDALEVLLKTDVRKAVEAYKAPPPPGPTGEFAGVVEKGNIDLANRGRVENADGSFSTIRSISFNQAGVEILIPTAISGKVVSDREAIAHYRKTGQHLGKFKTPADADGYAEALHNAQERYYNDADPAVNGDLRRLREGASKIEVERILDQGFFKNSGDGVVLINPYPENKIGTAKAISDGNGNPIIFKVDLTKHREIEAGVQTTHENRLQLEVDRWKREDELMGEGR